MRILGAVPVERDGSAHFLVPPDTAVYFQLLDENRMELPRMRSFISFQRGEQRACAGCHETRGIAPRAAPTPLAAVRLDAQIKDTAASISVLTSEFLSDIGALATSGLNTLLSPSSPGQAVGVRATPPHSDVARDSAPRHDGSHRELLSVRT